MYRLLRLSLFGLGLLSFSAASKAQTLLGPLPYLSRADSPFPDCVRLETFEDHAFDQPGVTVDAGYVTSSGFPSGLIDSVDADDGAIDGSGSFGDSYFSGGSTNLTFTFSAAVLGGLPTRVGVVWTDGSAAASFEAFGPVGQSLGVIGPVFIADGSFGGETAEDRFFGVMNPAGISAIRISSGGAFELDHLQYALASGPMLAGSESVRLGTPANPNALRPSKATPPIVGTLWAPYVDHANFVPAAVIDYLLLSFGPQVNQPTSLGTLLCIPPSSALIFAVPAGSPFKLHIPSDCLLVGLPGSSQAASLTLDGAVQLTNALDFVLGTH